MTEEENQLQKEGVIDRLLGSLLQNLEVSVTNVALRILTREK